MKRVPPIGPRQETRPAGNESKLGGGLGRGLDAYLAAVARGLPQA